MMYTKQQYLKDGECQSWLRTAQNSFSKNDSNKACMSTRDQGEKQHEKILLGHASHTYNGTTMEEAAGGPWAQDSPAQEPVSKLHSLRKTKMALLIKY